MIGSAMKIKLLKLLVLALFLTACGSGGGSEPTLTPPPASPTPIPPTGTPLPPTRTPTIAFTATSTATGTPIPTSTQPAATLISNTNANCRMGPGLTYPIFGVLDEGSVSVILGRNEDSTWYYVQHPDRDLKCWVFAAIVTASGNLESIEIVEPPPPPTLGPGSDYILNYFIILGSGGPVACEDSLYATAVGPMRTFNVADDVFTALNILLSNPSQYSGGLYNALYRTTMKVTGVTFNESNGRVRVQLEGGLGTPDDCDLMRIEAQVVSTVKQFPEVKSRIIYLGNLLFEDLTYVP